MSYSLRLTAAAEDDIRQIARYLDHHVPGLEEIQGSEIAACWPSNRRSVESSARRSCTHGFTAVPTALSFRDFGCPCGTAWRVRVGH